MGKLSFLFKSKSEKPAITVTVEVPSPSDEKHDLSPIPEIITPIASPQPIVPMPTFPDSHAKGHAEAGTNSATCCSTAVSIEADARGSHCCRIM